MVQGFQSKRGSCRSEVQLWGVDSTKNSPPVHDVWAAEANGAPCSKEITKQSFHGSRAGLFRDWLARTEDAEHQRQKREVQYQGRPSSGVLMKSPLVSRISMISQLPILFGSNLYDWNLIWDIATSTFEDLFQQGVYASLAGIFGVPKYEKIVIQVCVYIYYIILHMNITNIYIYIFTSIYIYVLHVYIYIYIYISILIWILTMFDLLLFLPANPYVVGSWDLQTFFYRHQHCLHLCLPYHMVYIYIYTVQYK